jgi:nitroreductase
MDEGAHPVSEISLYEGLLTTRAIRRYTNEPVTESALRDILFAATRAPSRSASWS